jgi:beta propeller repeat protein
MGTSNKSYFIPDLQEAGYYYLKVNATDRYGEVSESEIGEFLYDSENPIVEWFKPVFLTYDGYELVDVTVGDEIGSDISPDGMRVFGKIWPGSPDYIAVSLSDNFRLKMAGTDITVIRVLFSSSTPGGGFEEDFIQLALAGSSSHTIYSKTLYEDMDANTVDLFNDPYGDKLELNEENETIVFIAPEEGFANQDGSLPDGWFTIKVIAKDSVKNPRNDIEYHAYFQVDYNEPIVATNIQVGRKDYISNGDVFVKGGASNYITFQGGNTDDPTLSFVELQTSSSTAKYNVVDNPFTPENEAPNWITQIRMDRKDIPDDGNYNLIWIPEANGSNIRVVSWDRARNSNISDYFNDFIVDAEGPLSPIGLDVQIDEDVVDLKCKIEDNQEGSGVAYAEIFLSGEIIEVEDMYNGGVTVKPGTDDGGNLWVKFDYEAPESVDNILDILDIRAVDNVGNNGTSWQDSRSFYNFTSHYTITLNPSPMSFAFGSQSNPSLHGSIIAWEDDRNGASDIFMFDLDNPDEIVQVSETSSELATGEYETHMQRMPMVYDRKIVWMHEWWDFSDHEYNIRLYDLDDPVQGGELLFDIGELPLTLEYSGNWIVWTDLADDGDLFTPFALFVYDIEAGTSGKMMNFGGSYALDGDRLLYFDDPDSQTIGEEKTILKIHNLTTDALEMEKTFYSKSYDIDNPDFHGDYIVWEDGRLDDSGLFEDGNTDIYLIDLSKSKIVQVTVNESAQEKPKVHGDYIVWTDKRSGSSAVYAYSISRNKHAVICENGTGNVDPQVYGDYVVWENVESWDNSTVYVYDLAGVTWLDSPAVFSDLNANPSGQDEIIVEIEDPLDGATVSGEITISGEATNMPIGNDDCEVKVRIDDGAWKGTSRAVYAYGSCFWEVDWNSRAVENGQHTIQAKAYNGTEWSDVAEIEITVDNEGGQATVIEVPDWKVGDSWTWTLTVEDVAMTLKEKVVGRDVTETDNGTSLGEKCYVIEAESSVAGAVYESSKAWLSMSTLELLAEEYVGDGEPIYLYGFLSVFDWPLVITEGGPYEWSDGGEVTVGAGTFDTYKFEGTGGFIYYSPDAGHIVKTEFTDMNYELESIKEGSGNGGDDEFQIAGMNGLTVLGGIGALVVIVVAVLFMSMAGKAKGETPEQTPQDPGKQLPPAAPGQLQSPQQPLAPPPAIQQIKQSQPQPMTPQQPPATTQPPQAAIPQTPQAYAQPQQPAQQPQQQMWQQSPAQSPQPTVPQSPQLPPAARVPRTATPQTQPPAMAQPRQPNVTQPAQPQQPTAPPQVNWKCGNCGSMMAPNYMFCTACGTRKAS